MKAFEYYRASNTKEAVAILSQYGEKAAILAGGSDLLSIMKDGIGGPKFNLPQHLIDIKECGDLKSIKEAKGVLRIGAAVTISEIVSSSLIKEKCPLLGQTASQIAVPQIRNVGTIGGNLCQRPRCWYFRGRLFKDCFRKGGDYCYAPGGENQYHAIVGGGKCFMVYPSDMAVALLALKARLEVSGSKGRRIVPLERFYVSPNKNVLRENVLSPQEMVTTVEIPLDSSAKGVFLKLKERQAFDFAVVSVAINVAFKGTKIAEGRIVFGGVAPYPYRDLKAELALKGRSIAEARAEAVRSSLAEAEPLSGNAYKVTAAKGLLEKAISTLT